MALTDVTLIYTVDNYYDGHDEFGLTWNDPELAVTWHFDGIPTLSNRDLENPLFSAIPVE